MDWNRQQANWQNFEYTQPQFADIEQQFLVSVGQSLGAYQHLSQNNLQWLTIDLMTQEALKTSQIEGEMINRACIRSSVKQLMGLKDDMKKCPPAERGIAQMMNSLYDSYQEPLTHDKLYNWHLMLTKTRCLLVQNHCPRWYALVLLIYTLWPYTLLKMGTVVLGVRSLLNHCLNP